MKLRALAVPRGGAVELRPWSPPCPAARPAPAWLGRGGERGWGGRGAAGRCGRSGQGPALPPERGPSRSRSRGGRRGGRGADTGVRAGGALEAAAPFPALRSSRPPGAKGRAPRPGVQTWPRPRVEESERGPAAPARPHPRGGCLPHGGAACRLRRNVTLDAARRPMEEPHWRPHVV